jgi:hypothetical protein
METCLQKSTNMIGPTQSYLSHLTIRAGNVISLCVCNCGRASSYGNTVNVLHESFFF